MMVFKRKQIVVLSLILMILVAGYLQYSYKKSGSSADNRTNERIGEAVYVDNSGGTEMFDEEGVTALEGELAQEDEIVVPASAETNNYFAQAKLDREVTRSKNFEALENITRDENADQQAKAVAYEQLARLTEIAEKEMKVENLIKQRGIEDVIAFVSEDGSVDIIVKAPKLTPELTAQIVDVVSRHANVDITNITLKNMWL